MHRPIFLALAVCLGAPLSLAAQPLQPEQVVRVSAPSEGLGRPIIGKVVETYNDTLVVDAPGRVPFSEERVLIRHYLPLSTVETLEVPDRRHARAAGTLVGAAVGTAVGFAVAKVDEKLSIAGLGPKQCRDNDRDCVEQGFAYESRTLPITLGGTVIGALVGAFWPGHRWRRVVPMSPQASVQVDGSVVVSATATF